jgi:hypothetical protein
MRDRTAMTEPLTIGQQLVARWESVNSGWSEPADLAEAIDAAIAAERERCVRIESAARLVAMTLNGGFISCDCGRQESMTDIDFAADLYAALGITPAL